MGYYFVASKKPIKRENTTPQAAAFPEVFKSVHGFPSFIVKANRLYLL